MIYLDHNATTRPAPQVVTAVIDALERGWANPSSMHRLGQAARRAVELARDSVAALLCCRPDEVVFTSGGTESIDLAVHGARGDGGLATSRLEHKAVRESAERLSRGGTEVIWLDHDRRGVIDLDGLERLLRARGAQIGLVSVMWANHETGIVQPIDAIGAMCRRLGVRFHTDAVQRAGKGAIDLATLPVDLLSFSAHKFHGPKGAGGLFVRKGVRLEGHLAGGPQERGRRGGTENVPGIVGMGVAAGLARSWLAGDGPQRVSRLRDDLERRLAAAAGAVVNGGTAPRCSDTTNLGFEGLEAEPILLSLSERGVCAAAGAACASGSVEPSPVLLALGVPQDIAAGSIRFSLGRDTTPGEIDAAVEVVSDVVRQLRSALSPGRSR